MSDPAATGGAAGAAAGGAPTLTPAAVDAILADFRGWLLELAQESGVRSQGTGVRSQESEHLRPPSSLTPDSRSLTPGVDLFTLVGQFTALRHEVNLQTKAARAAVEQNAEVLRQLAAAQPAPAAPPPPSDDEVRPLVKALIDIADALALSLRQMERLRESVDPLLVDLGEPLVPPEPPAAPRQGFFARLFGGRPQPGPDVGWEPRGVAKRAQAADKLQRLAAAAVDGYAMSLRRAERVLPTFGLERIACENEPFDPERMEAVEVVTDSGRPPGTVVEEVRPGYLWRGKVFRFALVKVAR